jgi:hypothetical protein
MTKSNGPGTIFNSSYFQKIKEEASESSMVFVCDFFPLQRLNGWVDFHQTL